MDKLLQKKAKIKKRIETYQKRLLEVEKKIAALIVKKGSPNAV